MRANTKPEKVPEGLRWREDIRVYNRTNSVVVVPTKDKEWQIKIDPDKYEVLNWKQIEWIHNKTIAFPSGLLEFDERDAEEIYRALRITDVKNILFESTICEILLNPTLGNLQRFIEVRDPLTIDRIRARVIKMINEGHEFKAKVLDCINARFIEIRKGKIKSEIQLTPIVNTALAQQSEVDELKAMLAAQSAQIAQLLAAQQQPESKPVTKATPKTQKGDHNDD